MCTVAGSGVSAVSPSRRAGVGGRLPHLPAHRNGWPGWGAVSGLATGRTSHRACRGRPSSVLPGGRVRRSYSWERHWGRRGLAGIEPADGKRPDRSALPSPLRSHGRGAGYSVVVCGFGQDRPLQAPERLRPAGLHLVYASSVDPHRMTKPATAGGVTAFDWSHLKDTYRSMGSTYVTSLRIASAYAASSSCFLFDGFPYAEACIRAHRFRTFRTW
ncbi:hypothetical protein QFZ61_002075 [Arthrobacter sp. B3I4]|nr:hypothetical protein [Arthrobacter sp. B3I4]